MKNPSQNQIKKKELTLKQLSFIDQYMIYAGNGTKAYLESDFETDDRNVAQANASRLLSNAMVQAEIGKRRKEIRKQVNCTLIDVINGLWDLADRSSKEFYDDIGNLISIPDLTDKAARAIASFEEESDRRGGGKLKKNKGSILKKVKTHSKTDAYRELRKHFEGDSVTLGWDQEAAARTMLEIIQSHPDPKVVKAIWKKVEERVKNAIDG